MCEAARPFVEQQLRDAVEVRLQGDLALAVVGQPPLFLQAVVGDLALGLALPAREGQAREAHDHWNEQRGEELQPVPEGLRGLQQANVGRVRRTADGPWPE